MREYSLDSYNDAMERINAIIGSINNPAENLSRDRLLRVQKGLHHLLTEVIPAIEDEQLRVEISYWVNCLHDITRCEECDSKQEAIHA